MNNYFSNLNELINDLENKGYFIEANTLNNKFFKEAKDKFKKIYDVPFEMNLDDALNVFDSNTYEVDSTGNWEETETISDFREEASDNMLHFPAAVDSNHLVFYNEDDGEVEVMNMIPKHHMDTLHKNPDKSTKWIKRAQD